jgi:hypothetical protein
MASGAATAGTFVSGKVSELHQELRRLHKNVSENNSDLQQYALLKRAKSG